MDNLTENEKKRLELLTNIKKMLDADYHYKDIAAFMEEVLPKQSKVLEARIDEKYLLEVLPHKVYNSTDCIINTG